MVPHLPGLSGRPGWVRSSAWIWLFSSMETHHRVRGRVHVEADDVIELGGEVGIVGSLEGADPVRLELVGLPDALDRAQRKAHGLGHGAAGPMGDAAGRLAQGELPPRMATLASDTGGMPGGRVLSRNRPSMPSSAKRCCHRHTIGRLMPTRLAISSTGSRSAESRTIWPAEHAFEPDCGRPGLQSEACGRRA